MGKTLYLMRHGQTMFNVRRKIQGWCDSPLTEKGCDQALHARRYFEDAGITFDHVYCSSAGRACETAELVSDVPYTPTKGLREWGFGLFEGESRLLMPPTPWGDFFADFELDLGPWLVLARPHRFHDAVDFLLGENDGVVVAEEFDHARRGVNQMPGGVVHLHLNEDVARIHPALARVLAAVANFLNAFDRQEHLAEAVAQFAAGNAFLKRLDHALFHRGIHVQRVPLHFLIVRHD